MNTIINRLMIDFETQFTTTLTWTKTNRYSIVDPSLTCDH